MNSRKAQTSFQKPLLPFHGVIKKKKQTTTENNKKNQGLLVQEETDFELLVSSLHLPSGGITGVCTTSGFFFFCHPVNNLGSELERKPGGGGAHL